MRDEKEIQRVIEHFEKFMSKAQGIECRLCLHPNRIAINRMILEREKSDHKIAAALEIEPGFVRYHRISCLVNRGDANPRDVRIGRFPVFGTELSQKKWMVDELLLLREEELAKPKPDNKALLKLAKMIDDAANELRKARTVRRSKSKAKDAPEEEDLDLSDEQKKQMNLVNKKQEANGATAD